MPNVQVRDHVLWTKHITDDDGAVERLEALPAGSTIKLCIAGTTGEWEKTRSAGTGNALRPLGAAKKHWGELFAKRRGDLVELELAEAMPERWQGASPSERDAGWQAFRALSRAGWRSTKKPGGRDELHER